MSNDEWSTVIRISEDKLNHGDAWKFMEFLDTQLFTGSNVRVVYTMDGYFEIQEEFIDD